MLIRTSRNAASIVAWAIATALAAIVMVSPAAASPKKPPVDKNQIQIDPSQEQVVAACGRTTGCSFNTNPDGSGYGCSPTTCFSCNGQTCQPIKAVIKGGKQPVGHSPVGRTSAVDSVLGASATVRGISQGATHQVAAQSSSSPSSSHKH